MELKIASKSIAIDSAILLACFSAATYFLGYLKYYYLLDKLGIHVMVAEIYSFPTIFVSGIAIIISVLFIPVVVFSATRIKNYMLSVFLIMLATFLSFSTSNFKLAPFSNYLVVPIIIFTLLLLYVVKKISFLNPTFVIIALMIWASAMFASYISYTPIQRGIYTNEGAIKTYNQDMGVFGYLITETKIITDGNDCVRLDNDTFQTFGLLLSRNNENHYFYRNGRLYLIPADNVIYFYSSEY